MNLPDPSDISKLSNEQLTAVLDNLFEPCSTLNAYLVPLIKNETFLTYTDLIEFARIKLLELLNTYKSDQTNTPLREKICKIVSAHPRLGVPKKKVKLSAHSQNEQKSLNDDNTELAAALIRLNNEYEIAFPGLIFVVFVNGRSRDEIMNIMKDRISSSNWLQEVNIAFNSMADIAIDRAKKLNAKL
ncbi:hypothetical protein C6P40_002301 [Pichia californica]|uniref:Oxo-4-hydroxy-4-carboxy-5-ureidoimidazoline decarboxylase domain-containing protein n=1 Tax=Pichia californica TaxID=460514 RepID=A0A9P6WJX3_9ASCO|nr:hypothetical protein C6P40_002301 [[Candida] californica]